MLDVDACFHQQSVISTNLQVAAHREDLPPLPVRSSMLRPTTDEQLQKSDTVIMIGPRRLVFLPSVRSVG